jgi:hypothetical protein
MKMHVVVNSRNEVIATATITPTTAGKNEGFIGFDPLSDQTVYEMEISDADISKDPSELHKKCDQVIKSGAARRLGPLFQ